MTAFQPGVRVVFLMFIVPSNHLIHHTRSFFLSALDSLPVFFHTRDFASRLAYLPRVKIYMPSIQLAHQITHPFSLSPFPPFSYPISESGNGNDCGRNTVDTVKAAAPAVVKIMRNCGSGSGFVISENGWVVTNEHVIAKATKEEVIAISFPDGRKYVAKVRESPLLFILSVSRRSCTLP